MLLRDALNATRDGDTPVLWAQYENHSGQAAATENLYGCRAFRKLIYDFLLSEGTFKPTLGCR